MSDRHQLKRTMQSARRPASTAWIVHSVLIGCLVAASLAVTACGSSGPSASSGPKASSRSVTVLNTKKIARAIERSSLAQRGVHADVSCPAGVLQKKGVVFSCTAVVGSNSTPFVVTQLDGSGEVHYQAG